MSISSQTSSQQVPRDSSFSLYSNSLVEVCNLALSRAGGHRITNIASLGEGSSEARQCAIKLPHLIRTALSLYSWGFATRREPLALLGLRENSSLFSYQYPSDCLTARAVFSATNLRNSQDTSSIIESSNIQDSQPFHTEIDKDNTRILLCGLSDAVLLYTAYISEPNAWSTLFYDALAWQLASELCISLGNDLQKSRNLEVKANQIWEQAKNADAKESYSQTYGGSYQKARG